jgi:hypothetical protein
MNTGIQFVGVLFVLIQVQPNLVSSGNRTLQIAQTAFTLRSLVGAPRFLEMFLLRCGRLKFGRSVEMQLEDVNVGAGLCLSQTTEALIICLS